MGLHGAGVLAIWNDVVPDGEAEFNHWHTLEHVPERLGIPGFLRGRRYQAVSGSPKYFTLYEAETVETFAGEAYLARLNDPTPWTRRALPLFRNTNRTACRVTRSLGLGVGAILATLRLAPMPGREEELRAWLTGTALPELASRPGLVGAHLLEAELSATRVPTSERKLRDRDDEVAAWALLLEGLEAEGVETVSRELVSREALSRRGASPEPILGVYRLLYCLAKADGREPPGERDRR